eukprot:scaffold1508_cov110-Isochrysis_galbana.AAC.2
MPGSVNGEPAGLCWLMVRLSASVPNVATIEPTTMYGEIKSRRLQTATVLPATTSHLLAELAANMAVGGLAAMQTAVRLTDDAGASGRGAVNESPAVGL